MREPSARALMKWFGAVASLAAAWRHQGFFGRLLLQSGSFVFTEIGEHGRGHLRPGGRVRQPLPQAARRACGARLRQLRRLVVDLLQPLDGPAAAGRRAERPLREANDGHNWENWRDRLREGLSICSLGRSGTSTSNVHLHIAHAAVTRNIGLSLGADICWPLAFEQILADSQLKLSRPGPVDFACERVALRPYLLEQGCKYDVVVDRLTHWFALRRVDQEGRLMDDLYVYNNPWSVQSYEKHSSYCACARARDADPQTMMLPQKGGEASDLDYTLQNYAHLFELGPLGEQLGYPSFLKPYDGGGWRGVSKVDDADWW